MGVEHRGKWPQIAPRPRHGGPGKNPYRLRMSSGHREAVGFGAMMGCTYEQSGGGPRGVDIKEVADVKSAMQLRKFALRLPWWG